MGRSFLLAALLLVAAPQPALAGSVSLGQVSTDPKYQYATSTLFFVAAPGERNEIVVTPAGTRDVPTFTLHDAGAPVSVSVAAPGFPPGGCTVIDVRTVSCVASLVFVEAGDGDDTVTVLPVPVGGHVGGSYVRGGDGADTLTAGGLVAGGPGDDVLACAASCVLAGGGGNDVLRGGSDDDVLSGDGDGPPQYIGYDTRTTDAVQPGNDTIDGGGGRDTLTFRGRRSDVKIDLAAGAAAGSGGERDRLAGIENVAGGDGNDFLLGDAGANQLEGGAGNDRIAGRGGDDYLLGSLVPDTNEFSFTATLPDPGADSLSGGVGDDTLDAGSERGDALSGGAGDDVLQDGLRSASRARTVRCGSGEDRIEFALQGQRVSDCESLVLGFGAERLALRPERRSGGRLRFAFECRGADPCTMAIGVRLGSGPRARRTIKIASGEDRTFLVRPRRAVRRGDLVDVQFILASKYGTPYGARWRVRL